MIELVFI